jgi:hypothetical protein
LIDSAEIRESLVNLSAAKATVFGADIHRFQLNPPLSEVEVVAFEQTHRTALPGDYRDFVIRIGNGGAGPFYGIFPLGLMDDGMDLRSWQFSGGIAGDLAKPFPHSAEWNDLAGLPEFESARADRNEEADLDSAIEAFERRYWDGALMNGAFPICHAGCAIRIWMVTNGEQSGRLWCDKRAEYGGIAPLTLKSGAHATFGVWYEEWLSDCLETLG